MRSLKRLTWAVGMLPLLVLTAEYMTVGLGANPIETVVRSLGDWAMRLLLMSLAVTPLRTLSGWGKVAGLRRTVGLLAFTYACLHVLAYVGVDQFFDWQTLLKDVLKRRYITVGFAAFVLLIPLALTSRDSIMRRMGAQRWRALHRAIYIIAPLVVLHFFMMIKAGYERPMLYGMAAGGLLAYRLVRSGLRTTAESRSGA